MKFGCHSQEKESNRRLLNQLDDFDQDIIIGNTISNKQEKAAVNEGTCDQEYTIDTSCNILAAKETLVNVRTLERCFIEVIDKEMGNKVDTAQDRVQNAILTAIYSIITPKIK